MHPRVKGKRLRRGATAVFLLLLLLVAGILFHSSDKTSLLPPLPPTATRPTAVVTTASTRPSEEGRDRLRGNYNPEPDDMVNFRDLDPDTLSNDPVIDGGHYTDRQDRDMPRDGERYITFAEYLDCLGARLRVDYRSRREQDLTDAEREESFPYVVSMATVELGDIKALMCNVSVPIQHMMYVINGDLAAVRNFFHDVEQAFGFTKRLRVVWPGYNMGFSGAVNLAMRDAMRYSFDEVPFFFILNNDIRFPEGTLRASLPEFFRVTRQDKEVLEGLRAEVAAEPSEYTPKDRRRPLLRSTDNSTLLVTSPSLPDRLRYMPYEERKRIFEKHYGALYFDPNTDTAAFGMSRLAMETVGFMDENLYPAYYEDTDWRYRQTWLGLPDFFVKDIKPKLHFVNALLKMSRRYLLRPNTSTEAERWARATGHIALGTMPYWMMNRKYGLENRLGKEPYEHCRDLPLDAWVMDVPRRKAILRALAISRDFFKSGPDRRTDSLLDWLNEPERSILLNELAGDDINVFVARAFNNCALVSHEDIA